MRATFEATDSPTMSEGLQHQKPTGMPASRQTRSGWVIRCAALLGHSLMLLRANVSAQ